MGSFQLQEIELIPRAPLQFWTEEAAFRMGPVGGPWASETGLGRAI